MTGPADSPEAVAADANAGDDYAGYDAVVFDLDGTLVDLAVDWDAAAADAVELFERAGHDAAGADLWGLLERADAVDLRSDLEAVLADHETAGAAASARLPRADHLPLSVPTGVCSLNCEMACRTALDRHGIADHVRSVVGRDSVATYKPDPEPLLATFDGLGVAPADGLFVGDSERDAATAERAGVDFRWA
ncbi:HAD hydrolase-like protein [Halobaculum sp. CBA1158]|uniref:HAD family hydrolase n=1 Tax=Halobaculum sp. CBA1158 TaxID=2904243 RepID=UPI001F1731AC|nr:HAD hydrolase-like protein [Halobaculum sp. CBA1158]UIO98589.1 HAD hydrolase-like protein [Halobaculum sp. CBA1158]